VVSLGAVLLTTTGETTAHYFSRLAANQLCRVRNGKLPGITEQYCFDQEKLLHQVLHLELEHTPFAIDHGDLAPFNIIVDSEHNVTG
jgi:RIO-like serine/threonine protein kinase